MSIFAELKSKLWFDWEMCRNNALFKLPIKGFVLFTPLNKRFGVIEGVNSIGEFDPL